MNVDAPPLYSHQKRKRSIQDAGNMPLLISDPELELEAPEFPQKRHVSEMMASGLHRHMSLTSSQDDGSTSEGGLHSMSTGRTPTPPARSVSGNAPTSSTKRDGLVRNGNIFDAHALQQQQQLVLEEPSQFMMCLSESSQLTQPNSLDEDGAPASSPHECLFPAPAPRNPNQSSSTSAALAGQAGAAGSNQDGGALHAPSVRIPTWPPAGSDVELRQLKPASAQPNTEAVSPMLAERHSGSGAAACSSAAQPLASRRSDSLFRSLGAGLLMPQAGLGPPISPIGTDMASKQRPVTGRLNQQAGMSLPMAGGEMMPPSPSDARFAFADLRKTALLRSFRQRNDSEGSGPMQVTQEACGVSPAAVGPVPPCTGDAGMSGMQECTSADQLDTAAHSAPAAAAAVDSHTFSAPHRDPTQASLHHMQHASGSLEASSVAVRTGPHPVLAHARPPLTAVDSNTYAMAGMEAGSPPSFAGGVIAQASRSPYRAHSPPSQGGGFLQSGGTSFGMGPPPPPFNAGMPPLRRQRGSSPMQRSESWMDAAESTESSGSSVEDEVEQHVRRNQPVVLNAAAMVVPQHPHPFLDFRAFQIQRQLQAGGARAFVQQQQQGVRGLLKSGGLHSSVSGLSPPDVCMGGTSALVGTPAPMFSIADHVAQMRSSASGNTTNLVSIPESGEQHQ